MSKCDFFAKAEWDEEAGIWYISDTNFPGLVAEGPTAEAIFAKIRALIPELLEDNAHLIDWESDGNFPINLVTEQIEKSASRGNGQLHARRKKTIAPSRLHF